MRKTKKYTRYSIDEKNSIVKKYLNHEVSVHELVSKYDICDRSTLYRWVKQYRQFGTCVDGRGKAIKKDAPNKGRPNKYDVNLEDLSKEDLIERITMYEDIKKSIAYLLKEKQK